MLKYCLLYAFRQRHQNPLPYHLATPHPGLAEARSGRGRVRREARDATTRPAHHPSSTSRAGPRAPPPLLLPWGMANSPKQVAPDPLIRASRHPACHARSRPGRRGSPARSAIAGRLQVVRAIRQGRPPSPRRCPIPSGNTAGRIRGPRTARETPRPSPAARRD